MKVSQLDKIKKNVVTKVKGSSLVGLGVLLISSPAFAQTGGFGGMAKSVATDQGGGFLAAFLVVLQVIGAFFVGGALFMVVKHNKNNGQGQDTSWKMVGVLAIVGILMIFFGGTVKKAEESVWGSEGGSRSGIQIK